MSREQTMSYTGRALNDDDTVIVNVAGDLWAVSAKGWRTMLVAAQPLQHQPAMTEATPDDSPASRSEIKAREVIGDLKAGRIWKGTVRDLGDAVRRAEQDAAIGDAGKTGRGFGPVYGR